MPLTVASQLPENLVFTACTGRCGQFSLVDYINEFSASCLAEAEPPDLIYPRHWPLSNWVRGIQRRWIVTDEDLGRGKALGWHDNDHSEPMRRLAERRLRRISRKCTRRGADSYFEASKFFIRSYCDAVFEQRPDLGVLLLRRDPISNARSFCNRRKDYRLDGLMPDFRKACLPMDTNSLSKFQLYLWQWVEIELRYQRFLDDHAISRHYEFDTDDLNNPIRIEALLDHFSIRLKKSVHSLEPRNTNVSKGQPETAVSMGDLEAFDNFVDRIPASVVDKLPHLPEYRHKY